MNSAREGISFYFFDFDDNIMIRKLQHQIIQLFQRFSDCPGIPFRGVPRLRRRDRGIVTI